MATDHKKRRRKSDKAEHLKKLRSPRSAARYLEFFLAEGDKEAFLLALRDVVDAWGGIARLAPRLRVKRQTVYRILLPTGNPSLDTMLQVLKPLGLRLSVSPDKPA